MGNDDMLLTDRSFCSYAMLTQGLDSVMFLHQYRKFGVKADRWLGRGDRLLTSKIFAAQFIGAGRQM